MYSERDIERVLDAVGVSGNDHGRAAAGAVALYSALTLKRYCVGKSRAILTLTNVDFRGIFR